MADTIDKTTKVNLGILGTLIAMTALGAYRLSDLSSQVQTLGDNMKEVRRALDRNTAQINNDGKSVVILQTQVTALERRVRELERGK